MENESHDGLRKRAVAHYRSTEKLWLPRFDFLETRGYRLRPRYRPGWVPSWKPSEWPDHFEDGITAYVRNKILLSLSRSNLDTQGKTTLDAERISDHQLVFLKYVTKPSPEIEIGRFLSSPEMHQDPRNHAVPLLDVLEDLRDPQHAVIVLPLLRQINKPSFASVKECLDFIGQTLEVSECPPSQQVLHCD